MKRISSTTVRFYKKVFPILWFGFLGVFILVMVVSGAFSEDPVLVVIPGFMAVMGYFLLKKLVWGLVDEVFDCGDFLLIRNGGQEEQVPLSNIMNVSVSTAANPPSITLRLVRSSKFGEEISFSPAMPFSLNPFAKSEIAEDLIVRVDRARLKR